MWTSFTSCARHAASPANSPASSTMPRARTVPPPLVPPRAAFAAPIPIAPVPRIGASATLLIASADCKLASPPRFTSAVGSTVRALSVATIRPVTSKRDSYRWLDRRVSRAVAMARCIRFTPTGNCTRSSSICRVCLMLSTPASSRKGSTRAQRRRESFVRTSPDMIRRRTASFFRRLDITLACADMTRLSLISSRHCLDPSA
mmetsp:Transcript_22503/g.48733  ORF Transcript_22503/g.48733 Transcript_22503/m.48733 type:complete len:203 (+) Transcript_22503:548-1156(+)